MSSGAVGCLRRAFSAARKGLAHPGGDGIIGRMDSLVTAKIRQASGILAEQGIDLWLVFVRETAMHRDPVIPLVVGADVVWQSFFLFTAGGRAIALVGNLDADNFTGAAFTEVRSYTTGVRDDLLATLDRLQPRSIAVDYSRDDVSADGLTHGMYLLLCDYLAGTPYRERLVSAENIIGRLRSRKLPGEIHRLECAARSADELWREVADQVRAGMTEREIAGLVSAAMTRRGLEPSFETIVNAGDKTRPGHGRPTDARLEPGDLLHVDFGVRIDGYCSDIQRLLYLRRPGESTPPPELSEAFDCVRDIITESASECRPGRTGADIDAVARNRLRERGYPEYEHALGHQLGRSVHDGGAVLGPPWERYGRTPHVPLEAGNVFTLELEINLPGIGCVGLEEDVVVENTGARFLGPRQTELVVR